jgi:hypothetical protein
LQDGYRGQEASYFQSKRNCVGEHENGEVNITFVIVLAGECQVIVDSRTRGDDPMSETLTTTFLMKINDKLKITFNL